MEAFSNQVLQWYTQWISGNLNRAVFDAVKRAKYRNYLNNPDLKINKAGLEEKEYRRQHNEKHRALKDYTLNHEQIYRRADKDYDERLVACVWDAGDTYC